MAFLTCRQLFGTLRGWSWLLGILSLLPVVFLVYEYQVFSAWAKQQAENGGFVCGTGLAGLTLLCALVAVIFSLPALVCAVMAYQYAPSPRGLMRKLEVLVVGNVVVLLALMFLVSAIDYLLS
ncbi:hypothetical protein [Undibacterium sp. TJN19]|uniref:hypothetical protein n=1 Tax=Undibacterium sp. TJN19 TaxID=3413055 RepID=UPI003BF13FEA